MELLGPIAILVAVSAVIFHFVRIKGRVVEDEDALLAAKNVMEDDEVALEEYNHRSLDSIELGTLYERFIGHLYELKGYQVEYNGALKGLEDLGRDLIVRKGKELLVVQTKCWAGHRQIREKHVFQLYGSMSHFKITAKAHGMKTKAIVFVSYATYSGQAIQVAQDLGVELKTEKLDSSYPKVKCKISEKGDKTYHLPFDSDYDELNVDPSRGEFFARTVLEAFESGHRRPQKKHSAA